MAHKIIPLAMPKWGMEMTQGTIGSWTKQPGDDIAPGDVIVEIETDKMVNSYEAEFTGLLRRQMGEVGQTYPVGELIGVVADASVTDAELDAFISTYLEDKGASTAAPFRDSVATDAAFAMTVATGDRPAMTAEPGSAPVRAPISPIADSLARDEQLSILGIEPTGRLGRISVSDLEAAAGRRLGARARRVNASPRARRDAKMSGVNIARIKGSGQGGRILAADIARAPAHGHVSYQRAVADKHPTSSMRRAIARRLTQSKLTAPHIYLRNSVDMTRLMDLRADLKQIRPDQPISINDLLVRAAAVAASRVPEVNVQYTDEHILSFSQVDLGVAVAIDHGLIVPVIRGADRKSVFEIAAEVRDLAQRARQAALEPQQIEGGTLTLSNMGMLGIESFDAVINPPQAAILALGAVLPTPAVIDHEIAVISRMQVTLSCDHRAIDGATGARYLAEFRRLLESPLSLVLD